MNNVAYLEEYKDIRNQLSKELKTYLIKTQDPRETGRKIIWDTSAYFKEADWIGKPRKEAQVKFQLDSTYSYR